ncbi:T9SS type A sorting domain-containing protein [Niastella caeni]|uniref:T9SS type A sorting domain-containing protein n=1 Tax=Niastella caeni TaxID=2569763 RepID=A0A4S8I3W9_9BACT|nr:right-handed parallel beta-helix repeat-containing protein [Niastella caeni]THU41884.1 T9SS type A sorting domain-containing protein [Niastella caeni]
MKTPVTYFFVALLTLATLSASAVNYYVDPSSSGSNLGTVNDPWKSIADIPEYVNYFHPGDTVFFKRGQQYAGTLSINSSGSSAAPIVFMPYGSGNAPVFQYNLANTTESLIYNRVIIRLYQANYVVIDGFEMKDATMSETDHTITAHVGYGVYTYNSSHNIIKNLTITRLGAGIAIDGGSQNTITHCNIRNLRMILNTPDVAWDDFGANGIIVKGSDNIITHNHIQDCWAPSYDYQIDGGAIEMYGPISNNKILYNTASENLGFMEFGSGSAGQALNNVVGYNLSINNGHVFWLNTEGTYSLDVRNLQFFNNNIIETHAHRLPDVRNLIGISSTPSVSNVLTMKNNIFWLTTPMNITDPVTQPFNGPQLIHQNNLFHLSGGSLGYTLEASEQNLNPAVSLFADITSSPDPVSWNYNLQPASTAINFGQTTGIDKDFYGQAVPIGGAPDAGIAESISSVLPLQILSCSGFRGTTGNIIEWETTTDKADHFEIEKSNGGNNFKTIATVPYKPNPGSTTVKYEFTDKDMSNEILYYRIKAIEPGTQGFYSKIISIKNTSATDNMIVSPNPARDYVYLKIPGNDFLNKEMMLVNMAGMVIRKEKFNNSGSQVQLNVSMLPPGAYIIKLTDYKTGKNHSTRFTK